MPVPEPPRPIRLLLLADTHLGFDLPFQPRVERRRRGPDFFANFERALAPALARDVDLVVHGGDLLYRSRVPPALVEMALAPLLRVAERGVPVFVVPGNHERSRIPLTLWSAHPAIHIFDRPRSFTFSVAGATVVLGGFPFLSAARDAFVKVLAESGLVASAGDVRLLCLHQTIEGATVGPAEYVFRRGRDVIRGTDIPSGISAVLAGHIHRAQILRRDLQGQPLRAPVVYPGSVERTSFAERDEPKGYFVLEFDPFPPGRMARADFVRLPARPMLHHTLNCADEEPAIMAQRLRAELAALNPEAVVRLELEGPGATAVRSWLTAPQLRSLAPATMNIELAAERA